MLEILALALNNNYIYAIIITTLIVIIVLTILSIKKDRDKMLENKKPKKVEPVLEPAQNEEEQTRARLELEKVVNSMKNDIEKKPNPSDILTYEQEQEEQAIISYQELVEAVRKNNIEHQPSSDISMEVVGTQEEMPKPVEEKIKEEEIDRQVDNIMDMIDNISPKEEKEETLNQPIEEKTEKKFQTSEFISPIYGTQPQGEFRVRKEQMVEEEPETPSIDEIISNDLNNTEEFLDALKSFRNNL